tara:strand:+ start:46221 stop:46976 length:756 start_codon:yes stop_codon:yes gene_type:complete
LPNFKDHFSRQSEDYARFRPHYPDHLFQALGSLCADHSLAADIGTGSGQCAVRLADFFENVIALDPSENQVSKAQKHPSVRYAVAPAENTGCEAASADLITVAQALHWFEHEAFFQEAHRILRPGGLLAAFGYGHHFVEGCQETMDQFYHNVVGPYWPPERESIEARYEDIIRPEWLIPLEPPDVAMSASWNKKQLLGYISTWSAVQRYRDAMGHDPVKVLEESLRQCWPNADEEKTVRWPFFFVIGRKPE